MANSELMKPELMKSEPKLLYPFDKRGVGDKGIPDPKVKRDIPTSLPEIEFRASNPQLILLLR
jgi:hypothetical protein